MELRSFSRYFFKNFIDNSLYSIFNKMANLESTLLGKVVKSPSES